MAHSTANSGPSSAESPPRPKSSSMLYAMLPSVVQSRLPTLPSLRRPASMYGSRPRPKSADTSQQSSGSRTPDAGFGNAMVWSGEKAVEEFYLTEGSADMSEEDDMARTDRRTRRQAVFLEEHKSGIGWKFANQGITTSLRLSCARLMSVVDRLQSALSRCRGKLHDLSGSKIRERGLYETIIPPRRHLPPPRPARRPHNRRAVECPKLTPSWRGGTPPS